MKNVTAYDLKVKGIAALEEVLAYEAEALITVRGSPRLVVLQVERYQQLLEYELLAALAETRRDLDLGRTVEESPESHLARLESSP